MSRTKRMAPSLAILAGLAGCVFQGDLETALKKRDETIAKLESRVKAYEEKGPLHDQQFYDRVVADTNSATKLTREYAEKLAGENKTYLEQQAAQLRGSQQAGLTAVQSDVAAERRRNQTARTDLDITLQDLQDKLAEWSAVIGDPTRQSGIYADRRRAQEEAERLTRAYSLIGEIRTALTTFSDARTSAQINYETFRAETRPLLTELSNTLGDTNRNDADKIAYINTTFIRRLGAAYSAHQTRERNPPARGTR